MAETCLPSDVLRDIRSRYIWQQFSNMRGRTKQANADYNQLVYRQPGDIRRDHVSTGNSIYAHVLLSQRLDIWLRTLPSGANDLGRKRVC